MVMAVKISQHTCVFRGVEGSIHDQQDVKKGGGAGIFTGSGYEK